MEKVVLGLGSNVGNRERFIRNAIKEISLLGGIIVLSRSNVFQTEPWGVKYQRNFLNCILVCLCKLSTTDLFKSMKKIEKKFGRRKRKKWAPREIDIDILFFGNHIIRNRSIIIPHPLIAERNFVLIPMNELLPDFKHPVLNKKISALLINSKDDSKVIPYSWPIF